MHFKNSHVRNFFGFGGFIIFFLGIFPFCQAAHPSNEPIVSAVDIRIHDLSPDAGIIKKLAERLIRVKAGEPFSIEHLQESIDALRESGLFQKIYIPDPVERDEKIGLLFELTPFSLIKEIHIDGEFPMLEKEILKEMDRRVGDPFDPKAVPEMEKSLIRLFQRDGYIDPKVVIVSEMDEKDGRTLLEVSIQKGPYYRIRRVGVEGNRSNLDLELLTRLKTWQASRLFAGMPRFVEKDLEEDVTNLMKFYRRNGYADVTIDPRVEKDPAMRNVEILFRIQEGTRYAIVFSGNTAFSETTLMKELPLFDRGNKGDLALKRGIRVIRNRYQKAGFPEARLTVSDKTEEENLGPVRTIRIHIQEGQQSLLRSLRIEGNRAIDEVKIREKILTGPSGFRKIGAFHSKTWEEDKSAVESLYRQNGYLTPTLEDILTYEKDPETGNQWVDAVLRIREGVRTDVEKVTFDGLSVLTKAQALEAISLKPGTPYAEYRVSSDKTRLAELISEKGYPHVTVSEKIAFNDDRTGVEIAYTIDEGPFVKVGDIFIRGNFRTHRKVVLDRVDIREGKPYSLKRLLEDNRKVSRIQAFDNARLQLVGFEEKSDRVDVVWNVEERKPYLFEIGGGYDSAREYYVLGRLEDKNLFGRNKSIWVSGEYSRVSYLGEAGITDPDFFRSGITGTGSFFTEKQEKKNQTFGIRRYGGTLGFQKSIVDKYETGLAFRYEGRKQYRLDDEPIPPEEQEEYEPRTLFVVTPSIQYASVDSHVRPKKGLIARASVDASKGLDNTLDDFIRYRLEARYYRTPINRLTLALRAGCGVIQSYASDDDVADDQLFYLGGLGDVRGFEENKLRVDASGNPVGGRVEFLGNVEVRYDLGSNIEASIFYDLGAIRDAETDEGTDSLRSSVGLGLSYITPVGPISLMYGHKLDRKEGEIAGRIHFSIGYAF